MKSILRLSRRWPCNLHWLSVERICRPYSISTAPISAKHLDDPPFRMAVIGSGPAGFYTAYRVMQKLPETIVDMYEALPVPYGLVRFGVAPDHPEVKNCIEKFDEVAQSPRFNFIGNTPIGSHLSLATLKPHYDCMLLSYGASKDRRLGIPGEDLRGIYSARAFVGWYNGLPEYRDLNPDLGAGGQAVVIGQGNVAMDVARILLSNVDDLRHTDITEYALEALSRSRVDSVKIVGRRGLFQAAFTTKELRELTMLPSVAFHKLPGGTLPAEGAKLPRAQKRIVDILRKRSKQSSDTASTPSHKSWELKFQLSPQKFCASAESPEKLSHIKFEKTRLEEDAVTKQITAKGTRENENIPASLAFRSIGYKSEPIAGTIELGIPFDERKGIVCNVEGRVVRPNLDDESKYDHVPGVYTSGWVKRGPTGVIASTMVDAFDTGDMIVSDWVNGLVTGGQILSGRELGKGRTNLRGWDAIRDEVLKTGGHPVSWQDWKKIERAEQERGRLLGKPSEKFGSVEDMLSIL